MKAKEPLPADKPRRKSLRLRFSMLTLLIFMVLFSVLGAATHYGLRAVEAGVPFEAMLAVLLILAPGLMFLTLKVTILLSQWMRNNDKK